MSVCVYARSCVCVCVCVCPIICFQSINSIKYKQEKAFLLDTTNIMDSRTKRERHSHNDKNSLLNEDINMNVTRRYKDPYIQRPEVH